MSVKPEHGKRYVTKGEFITSQVLWDGRTSLFSAKCNNLSCRWDKEGVCIQVFDAVEIGDKFDLVREANELEIKEQYVKEKAKPLVEPHQNELDLDLVLRTLNSKSDQQHLAFIGTSIVATLIRKNTDYGSSVFKSPILCPNMPSRASILVRMSDKISRLARLQSNEAMVAETIEDTMRDLAGYAILYLASPEVNREPQKKV